MILHQYRFHRTSTMQSSIFTQNKNERHLLAQLQFFAEQHNNIKKEKWQKLERAMRIELTAPAWEAGVLPLYDARTQLEFTQCGLSLAKN